jgi:general secretion pathway protein F
MKLYRYRAKKGPSELLEGEILAQTQDEVIDKINDMGLTPVDVAEVAVRTAKERPAPVERFRSIGLRDRSVFYRHLARLVKSGVPILSALSLLHDAHENPSMKRILSEIRQVVREGGNLSQGMRGFPGVFSGFDSGMVQTGEAAGKLDEALTRLAVYHEAQAALLTKVATALAYPAVILLAGAGTLLFMFIYVIPQFTLFFKDLGQELPLVTRMLIAASDAVRIAWPALAVAGVFVWLYLRHTLAASEGRARFDRMLLGIPKFGPLMMKAEIARLARTLELLLASGIPVLNAVRLSLPSLRNEAVRRDLEKCYEAIQEGGGLSEGLKRIELVPAFVSHLVTIGEESGRLEESLGEIATWYEKDTEDSIKLMTQLLEPLIILAMGLVIAFMIFGVLLPVFSINTMV